MLHQQGADWNQLLRPAMNSKSNHFLAWGMLLLLIWSPLPLGSNRPWSMGLLAVACLLLAIHAELNRGAISSAAKSGGLYAKLLLLFALIPFLQLIPLPVSWGHWALLSADPYATTADGWYPISIDRQASLQSGLFILAAILLSLVAVPLFRQDLYLRRFVIVLAITATAISVYGLVIFFYGMDNWWTSRVAGFVALGVPGTFVNKNHFAGYLELVLPFVLIAALRLRGSEFKLSESRYLFLTMAVIQLVALVFTGSRGGVTAFALGFVATFMLLGVKLTRPVGRLGWTGGILAFLLLSALLVFSWDFYAQKVFPEMRLIQWKDSLTLVQSAWLGGTGAGTYEFIYPPLKSPELEFWLYDHAHNDYLEVLVTYGIFGLLLLLGTFGLLLGGAAHRARSQRYISDNPYLFAASWAALSFMIHGMVDFNFQIPANFLLFMLVLAILHARSTSHPQRSKHHPQV